MRIVEPEEGVMLHFQTTLTPTIHRLTLGLHRFFISIHSQRQCLLLCTIISQTCLVIVRYDLYPVLLYDTIYYKYDSPW